MENGHALMTGIRGEAIAKCLLEELCPVGIAAHVLDKKAGAAVFGELAGVDVQCTVLAVEAAQNIDGFGGNL